MPRASVERLVADLGALKLQFGAQHARRILAILRQLANTKIASAELLIEFHETLLFLRAYPQTADIVRATETQLKTFPERTAYLIEQGEDLSALEHPEMSGVAGLPVIDTFTYDIVNWLFQRRPKEVALDWEWFEDENRLGETWPRFLPLLEEDALVEAHVPYRDWLSRAARRRSEFQWLMTRFAELSLPAKEKSELFNSQKLYVRWSPDFKATRTGMRLAVRKFYYHRGPLIQRRDVSFKAEIDAPPPELQLLSQAEGEKILERAREASTVRYRELYGFTHGDPEAVYHAHLGRGVDLFVITLPPQRRLPLRAYHAAMIFKNGVAVGYFEGLSFFERMESGFNLYYTFREGETAWLYARTLNVMRSFTGVSAFALDPYQIGHENEEGIESGAFWFYRKLGFRPTQKALLEMTENEERKISTRKGYRSSPATLRKLAAGSMILELNQERTGDWDKFAVRNIGLAVQHKMAVEFDGNAQAMRQTTIRSTQRMLNVSPSDLDAKVLGDFVIVLSLVPDLEEWSNEEKELLLDVIRAKASGNEETYLGLMMQHTRLRRDLIRLGSAT